MEPGAIIELTTFVGPPICRYLKYHRKFNEYLNTLKTKKEDLNNRREDIAQKLDLELTSQKTARREVESWLRKSEQIIDETQRIEDRVQKGCCLSRAWRGKLVDKKIKEVVEVYNEGGGFFSGALVINAPPGIGMELPTTDLVGEATIKEKIWEHLISDKVFKIAVCGMGGIGKTTIMKHIHNELLKETKFNKVIWVTVSREFDVVKLQEIIASALGETNLLKDIKDETRRAGALSKMLKERKRHVLILDDVWNKIVLEDVGIPEPTVINGCKLILTTRSKEVARSMSCEVIEEVKPLSDAEALNLFLNKVGHEMVLIPTLESTLKQVVEQCAGLPLAIVAIATSMKGEYDNDVNMWKHGLEELKERVESVQDMEDEVLERLKFSYDRLTDNLKLCFLYCGLYPEDYEIEKEELIEYWIVEGYIDEMATRQQMHSKGQAILKRFENNCLLESAQDGRCVKMHDLIRDMALHITSQNPRYLVKTGMYLEELPKELERTKDVGKVSLMESKIPEITLDMTLPLPKFTTLSTLILKTKFQYWHAVADFILREIHESFFKLMIGLKILDLSYTGIVQLPNSISDLENLVALILHRCHYLRYMPSLEKLGALKKLDLGFKGIKNIPEGLEMLVNLTYLDLYSFGLEEMPRGILTKLSHLQYLRLDRTFTKVDDVASLKKLETLGVRFHNLQDYHLYLSQHRPTCLNNYSFDVGSVRTDVETSYIRRVGIGGSRICGELLMLLTDVQVLNIEECNDVRSLSDISCLKDATDLRICQISSCKQVECVFCLPFSCTILEGIEELHLSCLDNLSLLLGEERNGAISTLSTPKKPGIFSCLRFVEIMNCPKLESVFFPELIPHLQNLKRISFYGCSGLVKIVGGSESDEYDGDDEKNKEARENKSIILPLPKLTSIGLYNLPKLKSFCSSRYAIVCNSLETIRISNCPKLKRMSPLLPKLDKEQQFPPPSLQKIFIYPKESWDSLEWDDPNTKNVLESLVFYPWGS